MMRVPPTTHTHKMENLLPFLSQVTETLQIAVEANIGIQSLSY